MQAQAGDIAVATEPNVKAAISAADHAHSTPQPEKVQSLHKYPWKSRAGYSLHFKNVILLFTPTYSACGGGQRRCMFLSQVSLPPHIWLSIWQREAELQKESITLLQAMLLLYRFI